MLQGEEHPRAGLRISARGPAHLQLEVGSNGHFLKGAPAALALIVRRVHALEGGGGHPGQHGGSGSRGHGERGGRGALLLERLDAPEQLQEAVRRQIAAVLAHLLGIRAQQDGGGPAVVRPALLEVRPRIHIHADGDEALVKDAAHLGIPVGRLIHDVAPVAPLGCAVDEHVAPLAPGPVERLRPPCLPGEGLREPLLAGPDDVHLGGCPLADHASRASRGMTGSSQQKQQHGVAGVHAHTIRESGSDGFTEACAGRTIWRPCAPPRC